MVLCVLPEVCSRRARCIVAVHARGLTRRDLLLSGLTEVPAFSEMRRSYEDMVDAERREGKTLRCHTTRPNEGHTPVWGPRISSPDGTRLKVMWKNLVLDRMQAFRGDPTETMVQYLCVVMPEVWSALLAAHAV